MVRTVRSLPNANSSLVGATDRVVFDGLLGLIVREDPFALSWDGLGEERIMDLGRKGETSGSGMIASSASAE